MHFYYERKALFIAAKIRYKNEFAVDDHIVPRLTHIPMPIIYTTNRRILSFHPWKQLYSQTKTNII